MLLNTNGASSFYFKQIQPECRIKQVILNRYIINYKSYSKRNQVLLKISSICHDHGCNHFRVNACVWQLQDDENNVNSSVCKERQQMNNREQMCEAANRITDMRKLDASRRNFHCGGRGGVSAL